MTWFVYLDSGVAVEEHEASTSAEAIEVARQTYTEWLQKENRPHIQLSWNVEREHDGETYTRHKRGTNA